MTATWLKPEGRLAPLIAADPVDGRGSAVDPELTLEQIGFFASNAAHRRRYRHRAPASQRPSFSLLP